MPFLPSGDVDPNGIATWREQHTSEMLKARRIKDVKKGLVEYYPRHFAEVAIEARLILIGAEEDHLYEGQLGFLGESIASAFSFPPFSYHLASSGVKPLHGGHPERHTAPGHNPAKCYRWLQ